MSSQSAHPTKQPQAATPVAIRTSEDLVRSELAKVNRRLWTGKLTERQYNRLLERRRNLMNMLRGV